MIVRNNLYKVISFILALILACLTITAQAEIFGKDNRQDIYQVPQDSIPELKTILPAIVMLTSKDDLALSADSKTFHYKIAQVYTATDNTYQPTLDTTCTGVLVAPDLIATADHCIYSGIQNKVIVRGYALKRALKTKSQLNAFINQPRSVQDNLRHIKAIYLEKGLYDQNIDFALLQLDAPFPKNPETGNYDYLPVMPTAVTYNPKQITKVGTIGYTNHMPLKVLYGDKTQLLSADGMLAANLDSSGGNSGGPIFIQGTTSVIGLDVETLMMYPPRPKTTRYGTLESFLPVSGDWIDVDGNHGYAREYITPAIAFASSVKDYLDQHWHH